MRNINSKYFRQLKILIMIFAFTLSFSFGTFANAEDVYTTQDENTNEQENTQIYSNNAILIDYASGAVLYEKNSNNKIYPASTTKILTAIISIEKLNLTDTITASKNAVYSTPLGSSSAYLRVGEKMTVEQLLYCLLLQSGNDAANVLAETVSGSISEFVKLMNEKAIEIGCKNSHFTNAHGFHEDDHYTTPYDMVKIMQYAMKNDEFRRICETKSYVINETNMTNEKRYLKNTNKMLFDSTNSTSSVYYEYSVGGKTGYTEEARGTFVGYAKKGDSTIIAGIFDGSQNVSGLEARFLDAITLYNYGFSSFENSTIIDKNDLTFKIKDRNNSKIYTIMLKDNIDSLSDNKLYTVDYTTNIDLVKLSNSSINDESVGNISLSIDSYNWDLDNTYNLVLVKSEKYVDFGKIFSVILKPILIIFLTILLIIIYARLKRINSYDGGSRGSKKPKKHTQINKRVNYSNTIRSNSGGNGYKNMRF